MDKIKILTIMTSGLRKREGISTVILDYYSFFDTKKYQIDLLVAGEYDSKLVNEFEKIGVNIKKVPSRKHNLVNYILKFIRLIKKKIMMEFIFMGVVH